MTEDKWRKVCAQADSGDPLKDVTVLDELFQHALAMTECFERARRKLAALDRELSSEDVNYTKAPSAVNLLAYLNHQYPATIGNIPLVNFCESLRVLIQYAGAKIKSQSEALSVATTALRFYANQEHVEFPDQKNNLLEPSILDRGETAESALGEMSQLNPDTL